MKPYFAVSHHPTLSRPPIDGRLLEFQFPPLQERTLSNHLHLLIIPREDFPKIYLRLGFDFGTRNDPPDRSGLHLLLANTLKKGTQSRSYSEIMESVERVGGDLDTSVNEDFFVIHGEFLKEHIGTGLGVLSEIVRQPVFPEEEVEKERSKQIADLENEKSSPEFLAHRRLEKALFDPHPYGRYKTLDSLQGLTRSDLQNHHRRMFSPRLAYLVLAGDISVARAVDLAETNFAAWGSVPASSETFPSPLPLPEPTLQVVHRPGSQQANILLGNLLFARNHPDYEKSLVMNKILGGGGSGRLFLNLREEKGYTYGAYSNLETHQLTGIFSASAEVRTEVTAAAIAAFREELDKISREEVSRQELENARRYLQGIFPLQNETAGSIAALALREKLYRLGPNYWNRYLQKIGGVTVGDVQQAARLCIDPQRQVTVVVGDADKLAAQLTPLGKMRIFNLDDQELE